MRIAPTGCGHRTQPGKPCPPRSPNATAGFPDVARPAAATLTTISCRTGTSISRARFRRRRNSSRSITNSSATSPRGMQRQFRQTTDDRCLRRTRQRARSRLPLQNRIAGNGQRRGPLLQFAKRPGDPGSDKTVVIRRSPAAGRTSPHGSRPSRTICSARHRKKRWYRDCSAAILIGNDHRPEDPIGRAPVDR